MLITTYSDFRQQLKFYLDKVRNNHIRVIEKPANAEVVVVISKADYESIKETFYLIKSPANATRLLQSIEDYKNGLGQERRLIEK